MALLVLSSLFHFSASASTTLFCFGGCWRVSQRRHRHRRRPLGVDLRRKSPWGGFSSPKSGRPPLLKVACDWNFLVAEAEEGLWVLGNNSNGPLGLGHTNNALEPTLIQVEDLSEGPLRCLLALREGVIIIDSQGGVFSCGDNYFNQLGRYTGDLSTLQRIKNIPPMLTASCGGFHTLNGRERGRLVMGIRCFRPIGDW